MLNIVNTSEKRSKSVISSDFATENSENYSVLRICLSVIGGPHFSPLISFFKIDVSKREDIYAPSCVRTGASMDDNSLKV